MICLQKAIAKVLSAYIQSTKKNEWYSEAHKCEIDMETPKIKCNERYVLSKSL